MKPGHTAGLVHTDNQANMQANFIQTPSQACIILKARGEKIMLFRLLIPYISLLPKKGLRLEAFCVCVLYCVVCVCVRAYLCLCIHSCLHVCV